MDLMKIRNGLDEFDLDHLKRMYTLLFDMWCWEENNENLKSLLDMIDSRISELDAGSSVGHLRTKPIFRVVNNTNNGTKNIVFHNEEQNIDYTFFEINSNGFGALNISGELDVMLKEFINKEMFNTSGNSYDIRNTFLNEVNVQSYILENRINELSDELEKLKLSQNTG